MKTLKRLWKEEEGQDLVEYALLLAFISLAAAAIFPTIGSTLNTIFTNANTCLTSPGGCPASGGGGAGGGAIIFGL
jgi:pilus assembly protein Flp/PilA